MKYSIRAPILKVFAFTGRLLGRFLDRSMDTRNIRRILVIQFGGIGDVLRVLPTISSLHHAFPEASISVLTEFEESLFEMFAEKGAIAEFVHLRPRTDHRSMFRKLKLIRRLRTQRFDIIYNAAYGYGMAVSTIISFLIGAPYRIGFDKDGAGFLNTTKTTLLDNVPLIDQQAKLLQKAGIAGRCCFEECFRHTESMKAYARSFFTAHGVADELVVVLHPGSKWTGPGREWPPDRYADLIGKLMGRYKARIIVLGAAGEECLALHILQRLAGDSRCGNIVNAVAQTTILEAASLVAASDLFIGNDSGLLHVAIGYRVPTVAIFGFTASEQVIPAVSSCIPVEHSFGCRPCYAHQPFFTFRCTDVQCLKTVTVDDVMRGVREALSRAETDDAGEGGEHSSSAARGGPARRRMPAHTARQDNQLPLHSS